jgi:hypothetical protein
LFVVVSHASRITLSSLIDDDQPGTAVATVYAKLRCESQLGARRAKKRVDVSAVCIIPEMIFHEHLYSDLSLWHAGIIDQPPPAFVVRPSGGSFWFLVSCLWFASPMSIQLKITNQKLETRDQKPETTASIVSALLFFVGKWFASSKHSFGRM